MGFEERLIFGECADLRAGLGERRCNGGCIRGVPLQGALEGCVGEALRRQQPRAHRLDVGARVGAREARQAIDRALAGAPEAGEELARECSGVRPDALVRFDIATENFQSWAIKSGNVYAGILRNARTTPQGTLLIHQTATNRIIEVTPQRRTAVR